MPDGAPTVAKVAADTDESELATLLDSVVAPVSAGAPVPPARAEAGDAAADDGPELPDVALITTMVATMATTSTTGIERGQDAVAERNDSGRRAAGCRLMRDGRFDLFDMGESSWDLETWAEPAPAGGASTAGLDGMRRESGVTGSGRGRTTADAGANRSVRTRIELGGLRWVEERVRHAGGEWGRAEAAACRGGAQCEGRDHPAEDGGQDHARGGRRCRWRALAAGRIEAVQRSRERGLGRLDDLCGATRHGRQRCVRQHAAHDRRGKHHDQDETPPEGHVRHDNGRC